MMIILNSTLCCIQNLLGVQEPDGKAEAIMLYWEMLQSKAEPYKTWIIEEEHIIRQEFIDLFSSDFDQMFAELNQYISYEG